MNLLLKCNDLQETKNFYSSILGFTVSNSSNDACTVTNEDGTIIFTEMNALGKIPQCSGTIYFFLKDVDSYYKSTKGKVSEQWPLQIMTYGTKEFGIKDCNGYNLAFAQSRSD